ncbi:alpha/beta hydrolase [Hymenobacter busanensis]|uniref:Alpha/beta hydrolase n=1 Tax=Hymenobacter busanensis TaxID=2607656 RepID=A0A7L4ZXN7_9BACT|nr:dienelactone hydrolase family protein [Hymenobacter busanensis]KAA9332056.1 alpha/beta hydrolase [Hymenobacter busanensis]QHJ07606.1 alpha/beta hydrolase [Hymenobacter busanensis]
MEPVTAPKPIRLELPHATLAADLTLPPNAPGVIIFAHGSGSSRLSPRNQYVAQRLQQAGFGTLLFDFLTPAEDALMELRFDHALHTRRLIGATSWVCRELRLFDLNMGFFGASTGAASALQAAAELGDRVKAVILRGGRPDLALSALPQVKAATLLIVGGQDWPGVSLNEQALEALPGPKHLRVVPGAGHLFEEPGTLAEVGDLATDWCEKYLR